MTGPGEQLFVPLLAPDALIAATSDEAWLQAMLDAEAGLARAQAEVGLFPSAVAESIAACCARSRFDLAAIGRDGRDGANPVIPLVAALRAAVADDARTWVHHGATSQDVMDTAAMLVARRASSLIDADLHAVGDACAALADAHRATVMVGRTLMQAAAPTTFGLKAAGWLAAVDGSRAALAAATAAAPAQLGGAVGTLAAMGSAGPAVMTAFARQLGLAEPTVPWHGDRGPVVALASALGSVAGTAAKVAGDILLLAQGEVGEVRSGAGGSSTMPNKRNPVSAVGAVAAARRATALVPVFLGAMDVEHERGAGGWQAEWHALGELLTFAGGAAAHVRDALDGLEVDADAMAANVVRAGPSLVSESVVFALAPTLGRTDAAGAVKAAAGSADGLQALVAEHGLPDDVLDPAAWIGSADVLIDRAIAHHRGD